jgi:tRNA(Leu) C34 or U34 (ribose-2'-O)-methylase TrmL
MALPLMARLDTVDARTLRALPKVYLPMDAAIRSYNLSSSVAMGLSEAWRQQQMS